MAVREGVEPSIPYGIHTFQACSFGHSDTSPNVYAVNPFLFAQKTHLSVPLRRRANVHKHASKRNLIPFAKYLKNRLDLHFWEEWAD
jgi:hypothetical protein